MDRLSSTTWICLPAWGLTALRRKARKSGRREGGRSGLEEHRPRRPWGGPPLWHPAPQLSISRSKRLRLSPVNGNSDVAAVGHDHDLRDVAAGVVRAVRLVRGAPHLRAGHVYMWIVGSSAASGCQRWSRWIVELA